MGLLVPADKVGAVLRARLELRSGAEAAAAGAEEAEGQQRWHAVLQEALVTQRALQLALPARLLVYRSSRISLTAAPHQPAWLL